MNRRTTGLAALLAGGSLLYGGQIIFRNSADPDNVGTPTVTWTQQSNPVDVPHLMHFTNLLYDPVATKVIGMFVPNGGSSIYASSLHHYETAANDWTFLSGSTPSGNDCSTSWSPSPGPGSRHPVAHFAIDTLREKMYLADGVCANNERNDFWSYDLNTGVWTQVGGTVNLPVYGLMVYDDEDDVVVSFGMTANGSGELWVYCPAASLSAEQTAAGCSAAQTWTRLLGPDVEPTLPNYNRAWLNSMFWDGAINRVVIFTKDETTGNRAIWFYNVATQSISKRTGTTGTPSDVASLSTGAKDHVRITTGAYAGQYLFHKTTRELSCDGSPSDYLYNASIEAYRVVNTSGGGPQCSAHLAWDASAGKVVAWSGRTGEPVIWTGVVQ